MDQDILNYCFSNDAVRLPEEFNCFINFERKSANRTVIRRKLYHFAGIKPDINTDDVFNRLFLEYFIKTPWFSADTFGNIFKMFDGLNRIQQNTLLTMIRLIGKKRRVFFITPNNFSALRAMFEITDDEILIDASQTDALMKLLDVLREHKCVCFFFTENYHAIRNFLVGQNFVEGIDFVNGSEYHQMLTITQNYAQAIVRNM